MRQEPAEEEEVGVWWKPWAWDTVVHSPARWEIRRSDQQRLDAHLTDDTTIN